MHAGEPPLGGSPLPPAAAARPAPDAHLLVIIVARIGDTLLVTPMLRALKEACPQGTLTVLAHPKRLDVLRNLPFIDHLSPFTPKIAPLRGWLTLTPRRYDRAFVFGHDLPLLRYARRVAKNVVSFQADPPGHGDRVLTVPRPDTPMHAVKERLLLAEAVGVQARNLRLAYVVTAQERAWIAAWIERELRLEPAARPLIGLQMLSFPTKSQRDWPLSSFIELCQRIAEHDPSACFVVLGDEAARAKGEQLAAALPGKVRIAAGKLGLRQSAALISALDLYIGVDTGPTHIAGALEVPMVALYHRDFPGRYLAPLDRARCGVVEQPDSDPGAEGAGAFVSVQAVLAQVQRVMNKGEY
jgi:heptosyltransferase-3